MTIYHNHHIIPKHMGGSDDPSNLVRLTVEEHAEAHKKLYEEFGKPEDLIAYKALSGQINPSEASRQAWMLGSYKGGYAKKPNKVPAYNKSEFFCIYCKKQDKPHNILTGYGHTRCWELYTNTPPKRVNYSNNGLAKTHYEIRMKNGTHPNSSTTCPHCGKVGQYRAMKRWHFDNCKSL